MSENCIYCDKNLRFSERYVVKKAVKPSGQYRRWQTQGYCCLRCHDQDKKSVLIDPWCS